MKDNHNSPEWLFLVIGLFVADTVGLILAFSMAYRVRFVWQIFPLPAVQDAASYIYLATIMIPIWLGLFWSFQLYNSRYLLGGVKEYSLVANAATYGAVAVMIVAFFEREGGNISRGWLLLVWIFSIFLVGFLRFTIRRVVYGLRRKGLFLRRAIVAGADQQGISLAQHLSPPEKTGIEIVGFVHDFLAPGSAVGAGFRVLGEPMDLAEIARENKANLVIVVPGALSWESLQAVVRLASEGDSTIECRLLPGLYDVVTSGVEVDGRGPVPTLSVNRMRITGFDRLLKQTLDLSGTLLLSIIGLPLAVLLALISYRKGESLVEGREYLGMNGKSFKALAFNGWWNGEPGKNGTPLERYLYQRRLYRLPGFINVLKGEMSLVGPRRVTEKELSRQPLWRHSLLSVKPGLTGPWLLAGGEHLSLEESLRLDLNYVRNYSIWLDLQILFQTMQLLWRGFHRKAPVPEKEPIALPAPKLR